MKRILYFKELPEKLMRDNVYRKDFENRDINTEARKVEHLRVVFANALREFKALDFFNDVEKTEFHESLSYLYDDLVKKIV